MSVGWFITNTVPMPRHSQYFLRASGLVFNIKIYSTLFSKIKALISGIKVYLSQKQRVDAKSKGCAEDSLQRKTSGLKIA
jgi:hypothetical protein